MVSISDKDFRLLVEYVHDSWGINLSRKKSLVEGRLNGLLKEKGFADYGSLYNFIINDKSGEVIDAVINRLCTNHTFFMREEKHFAYFREHVLPQLRNTVKDKDLRIWSAGCSTGEEPYTLAMIIADYLGSEKSQWDARILATDISSQALHKAVQGLYTDEQINSIPGAWKINYFARLGDGKNMVCESIKQEIIFRRFNLIQKDFPFKKKFHVIFCRNVMIYFDAATKKDLIDRLYKHTEKGGYLFIGQSETINCYSSPFQYIMPAVYRKE